MQVDNQSRAEIERALMSAVQFASTTNDLLYIGNYMTRQGFNARALKIYRQAAEVDPTRHEPYMMGLALALKLKDVGAIQWACVGVMGQAWPEAQLNVVQAARRAAAVTLEQLKKENRTGRGRAISSRSRPSSGPRLCDSCELDGRRRNRFERRGAGRLGVLVPQSAHRVGGHHAQQFAGPHRRDGRRKHLGGLCRDPRLLGHVSHAGSPRVGKSERQ